MSFSPQLLINIFLFVWLLIISIFFFRLYFYHLKITKNGKNESLLNLLEKILSSQEEQKDALAKIIARCDTLEKEGKLHIQKLGLLRFNPFKDTGGDQSFILALVDAQNTGVIVSSLHTRTGTRWYAKQVIKGKGAEYELSAEEEKALKGAEFLEEISKKG